METLEKDVSNSDNHPRWDYSSLGYSCKKDFEIYLYFNRMGNPNYDPPYSGTAQDGDKFYDF